MKIVFDSLIFAMQEYGVIFCFAKAFLFSVRAINIALEMHLNRLESDCRAGDA
ncbi:MAG: hypothetical protein V4448_08340 [Pseudomonadota bacterium]